jgi:hypothetical protein
VTTHQDPLEEALRLIGFATERGLQVRLMGGLAFHAVAPEWRAPIDREGRDIDLATRSRDRKGLMELLSESGYTADRRHNAVHGHKQLYFVDTERDRPVDVLIERFEMCHVFEFGDRLSVSSPTIPLAELLLSKLQIAKINRKDILDASVLLAEQPLTTDDTGINTTRILALTSNDWGWWRTVGGNLSRLDAFIETDVAPGELDTGRSPRFDVGQHVRELHRMIDESPKSLRWKTRARVGDRVLWYHDPEELAH